MCLVMMLESGEKLGLSTRQMNLNHEPKHLQWLKLDKIVCAVFELLACGDASKNGQVFGSRLVGAPYKRQLKPV